MRDNMIDEALCHLGRYEWDANAWLYLFIMVTPDADRAGIYETGWYAWWMDHACE